MRPAAVAELVASRRTVRAFDRNGVIEEDALERILGAGPWAPQSVYATHPTRFIACRGEARDQLVELARQDHTVLKYVRYMYERSLLGQEEVWRELATRFAGTLGDAPVVVVALVQDDPHRIRLGHNLGSAWAAAQNMMLQATAEGMASGVITLSSAKVRLRVVEHLGFDPHEWTLAWLLNLGQASERDPPQRAERSGWEIRD